ncbi:SDR family oxidoreductase [Actinotalea sp. C106]|uniref:SDR family oxidoreductase n=1 Tax=Actinotalea sp. C106 TaxID=2908644 RepID=UPI0035AC104A
MASLAAYASSTWGMRGLIKCAALDLGRYGIRVSSIHPRGTRTPMAAGVHHAMFATQAIPRIGEVGEIASVVAFPLSAEASSITAPSSRWTARWCSVPWLLSPSEPRFRRHGSARVPWHALPR